MEGTINKSRRLAVLVAILGLTFVFGVFAGRRIVVSPKISTQRNYTANKGDAPPLVRDGVLKSLREFQTGYDKRDVSQLDDFMKRLFPKNLDARVIGTEVNEWKNGYEGISRMILTDWTDWGNLHLNVEDSVIDSNSSGDTAWLATSGTVDWPHTSRALRFASVLTQQDGKWLFRQLVFQWDERAVTISDLTKPQDLSRIGIR